MDFADDAADFGLPDDPVVRGALFGSEGAQSPFFSPDGNRFGFLQGSRGQNLLIVASLSGGAPEVLVDAEVGFDGGSWGTDGYIYYDGLTGGGTRGIMRVPASGGPVEQVTTVDTVQGESDHVWPHALPDGRGVLFTVIRSNDLNDADIAVSDPAAGGHRILTRGGDGQIHLIRPPAVRFE